MSDKALHRWLLVNYAGYPYAPNSLMPDNGLANLAGALLQTRNEVEILDYCTLGTLQRFSTPDLTAALDEGLDALRRGGDGALAWPRQAGAPRQPAAGRSRAPVANAPDGARHRR